MRKPNRTAAPAALLAMALGLAAAPAQALFIEGTATDQGGFFRYELFVRDNILAELSLVQFTDAPVGDPLIGPSLTAPAGFSASFYDSGLGILSFVPDVGVIGFQVPDTGPFGFDSLAGPASFFTQAEAFDGFLEAVPVDAVSITVVPAVEVPAPAVPALLGLGLALLAADRRRRE